MKLLICFLFLNFNISASTFEKVANTTYRNLENSLTIQVLPSAYPFDWSSSRGLIWTLVKNQYFSTMNGPLLGHVTAELNCTIDGKKVRRFTGQKVVELNGFRNYLLKGYGYSVLNRPGVNEYGPYLTIGGELDVYEKSLPKFERFIEANHFGSLSILITQENCIKVKSFIDKYKELTEKTKLAGNSYGFGANPLKFEGAGCASYVEVLLKLSGLKDYQKLIQREINVADELFGDPPKGKEVSLFGLIFNNRQTLYRHKNRKVVTFPDPQILYDFIMKAAKSPKSSFRQVLFVAKGNSEVFFVGVNGLN